MPLRKRLLKCTFSLPQGDVVVDQSIFLGVSIKKYALATQNSAQIIVVGLTSHVRSFLLGNFSAYQATGARLNPGSAAYVPVKIEAGWQTSDGASNTSIIFTGEIALAEPLSGPPDIGTRITAFTHQIDRTEFNTTQLNTSMPFKDLIAWAARQLGFGKNFTCRTSFDNQIISNPAAGVIQLGALVPYLQDLYKPNVAVFIDDDMLIAIDRGAARNPTAPMVTIDKPLDVQWTEFGAQSSCLFDGSILLWDAVILKSQLNPTLNDLPIVVYELEYNLASREAPFYVTVEGSPAAAEVQQ